MFTGLSVMIVLLLTVRAFTTRLYGYYYFLVWNMFLATIPVFLAALFKSFPMTITGFKLIELIVLSAMWLLFLPNTFYLLTDLMHLNQEVVVDERDKKHTQKITYYRGDPWFIFDSLILFLVAFYGMATGGYAVREFYRFLDVRYHGGAMMIISSVLLLSGFAVYIGRYNRWNSWDMFTKPHIVIKDMANTLKKRGEQKILLLVLVTSLIFELLSWALLAQR